MATVSMEDNESQGKSVSSTKILAKVRGYSREHNSMDQRVDIEDSVLDLSKSVLDLSKKSAVKQEWTNSEEQEVPLDLSTKEIKGNSWPGHSSFLTEQECALDLSRPFQSTSNPHQDPSVSGMNIASPSNNQTVVSVRKGTLSFGICLNKQSQPLSKNLQYPYLAQSLTLDESFSDRYEMTQTVAPSVEQFVNQSNADPYVVTQTENKSFEQVVKRSSADHYGIAQTVTQYKDQPELGSPGPPLLLPVSRAPPPLIPVPPFRNSFDLLNLSPPNLVKIDPQSSAVRVSGSYGQISRPESRGECDRQTASCLLGEIPTAPISQIKELLANKLQRNKSLGEEIGSRRETSLNKNNTPVLSFQRIDQRSAPEIDNRCAITSPNRTDGNECNKNDVDSSCQTTSSSGNIEYKSFLTKHVSDSSNKLENLGCLEDNVKSLCSQMDLEEENKKVKEVASVLLSFTNRHQISLKRDSEDAPESAIIYGNKELNLQKDVGNPSSCDIAISDNCNTTYAKRRKTITKDENDNVQSELTAGTSRTESDGKVIMSLRCKLCQKKFRTRRKVSFSEEAKKNFKCKTCHNKCKEEESKTSETKTVENYSPGSFSCEICKKSLNTAQQLFIHKASHLSNKKPQSRPRYPAEKVKCSECSRLFSSAYQLRLHMMTHRKVVDTSEVQLVHSKRSKPKENSSRRQYNYKNTCHVCSQRFRLKRTLNVHMGSHAEKEKTDTEKQTSLISELLSQYTGQGKETKHGIKSEETKTVTVDSKMASPDKQELKPNAEENNNENCDTENGTEKTLSQKHSKTKSFVRRKTILMRNATSSNNDLYSQKEKFQCDTCSELFARKLDLIIHAAAHKSIGPYLCDMCGKSFQRRGNLEVHLRLHSETLAYRCHLCGKKFASKAFQIRHLLWHKLPSKPKSFDSRQSLSDRTSKLKDFDNDVEDGEKTNTTDDNVDLVARSEQQEITMKCIKSEPKVSIANDIEESLADSKDFKPKLEPKRRNSRLTDQSKKSPSTHPFRCEKCCNRFTHRSSLLRHKKSHCLGFRSPSPLEVESDDSDELMKEVFPTNHNQPAEGKKDVQPIVNQSECLNLYEPVQEESRGSPSDLLRFISQFNKLEGSLSDRRVSSGQEQHSSVKVENQSELSSVDAKSENCSMLNGKKCEELLKVLTGKEVGSDEIREAHAKNLQPDYTGNIVSIATVETVCSSQSSPSLQSIGACNEFLSKLSVLSTVCSSIVTAEQSLFEAKSQINEARELDVSIRQILPSFLDNQDIQEEHIKIPTVVFEIAKTSDKNKQRNAKEIPSKNNTDVEMEKEMQEEVQKEQTKSDVMEANEEKKSQSGSSPSDRSSSQTGDDTLPSLPNLTELSDSIIQLTTVPQIEENMPKLPPLLNVFKCQLCAKLLFDYELQVHLSTHREECDDNSFIKADYIPNPGTSQWNLPMTDEIKAEEQNQEYMHGGESRRDSTEIVIPARRIQRRHTFDQIPTENEVNETDLKRPGHELRRSLSNLSQISTDDTDTTYDYSSSDVSSEPFSTPSTPTSSIPLAKLREELRNKIWARRKSQGLEELKIEFKTPEHAELSEEEKSRQNARRESNRQAAQRSRMRRRFILDSLMTELRQAEMINQQLKSEVLSLEDKKVSLVNILQTHECVKK